MQFNNPYWSTTQKIELLQKWILVHSYIYYELNDSVVSDCMYDDNVKQLLKLMENKQAAKASRFYKYFKEYDGSTGFHLYSSLGPALKRSVEMQAYFVSTMKRVTQ